ncbi:Pectinesterase 1 [Bienertia sinuspersici]
MGNKGVKLVIMFIILVVGLGTEVEANKVADRKTLLRVRTHKGHARTHAHANANAQGGPKPGVGVGDSTKLVNEMCATATYKDACIKSLSSLSQNCGNDPHEFFRSGVKLALDETTKASNLPNTLVSKASTNKMASSALSSCSDLLEQAIDRLKMASDQLSGDLNKTLKDGGTIFNLRLELGDVNTFSTNCLDELTEAEAPELQKVMQDGINNAKELAVNMLDIHDVVMYQYNDIFSRLTILMPSTLYNVH